MIELIKILAIFGLIISLLRLRLNFGLVMLIASIVLGILFKLGLIEIIKSSYLGIIESATINLAISLTLILVFENILRKTGTLKNMMSSMKSLLKDSRVIMATMPALIGLLPSVGGAAFSAPMVDESASSFNMSSERKAFINYWFRHPWEYILPLYPGIVLASAIISVPIGKLSLLQLPLALGIILTGIIWGFRGIGREISSRQEVSKTSILSSLLPVGSVVILVLIFRIDLSLALGIAILGLWVFHRYRPKDIFINFKEGISLNVILLVIGVMVFKALLKESGAVATLPDFFGSHGIPTTLLISLLPFIAGLLTGLTVGFVGITFPMIIHLLGGNPPIQLMAFAFGWGYVGVLLSPVHVCLILTKEYFHADLGGMYRRMITPCIILLFIAFGIRFL
jgi:integral membrane protein (TIGR00529 family)